MSILLQYIGIFWDVVALPFQSMEPFWGFMVICMILGTVAVIIFKYVSNQKKIKAFKKQMKIHFLEIRIYKDDFREILKAQKEILKNNFWYTVYSFQAAIPIIIVVLLSISQLNLRYGYAPIMPGEVFEVKVSYAQDADRRPEPQLVLPEGLEAVSPAMSLGEENEVSWQFQAAREGRYKVGFKVCDEEYTKEILIGRMDSPFGPQIVRAGFFAPFVNSIEPPLAKGARLENIEIGYKPRYFKCIFFGWNMHWLIVFPIICIGFGLVVRKILKVD